MARIRWITRSVVAARLRADRATQSAIAVQQSACIARLKRIGPPSQIVGPSTWPRTTTCSLVSIAYRVTSCSPKMSGIRAAIPPARTPSATSTRALRARYNSSSIAPAAKAGTTSRLLPSVKLPGPNQPAFDANSTIGSATAAAMTAMAKQSPKRIDEVFIPETRADTLAAGASASSYAPGRGSRCPLRRKSRRQSPARVR